MEDDMGRDGEGGVEGDVRGVETEAGGPEEGWPGKSRLKASWLRGTRPNEIIQGGQLTRVIPGV